MGLSETIQAEARKMTLATLTSKVNEAVAECANLAVRHANLAANPMLPAETAAVAQQRDVACAWRTVGAAELGRRQMDAASKQATKATAAARAKTPKKPAEPEPAPAVASVAAAPPPSSALPWIAGAAAVGVGVLAILGMRKPSVVRYVKAMPSKAAKTAKRVLK